MIFLIITKTKKSKDWYKGTQRRSNQTTRLNHTEERGFGVVACKTLTPGMTALSYPGKVMTILQARKSFLYLEDYWVGIKGTKDFVLVPSIDRIEAITKTGITSLGCIANEPGPDQLPNTFMTMRKRKKPIVLGGTLTLYLIVGQGCSMKKSIAVAVGSKNPVKVGAVLEAFQKSFPSADITIHGFDVPSGVSDQPMGHEETRRGAITRARFEYAPLVSTAAFLKYPRFLLGMQGKAFWLPKVHQPTRALVFSSVLKGD